jgi:hypothetical protein
MPELIFVLFQTVQINDFVSESEFVRDPLAFSLYSGSETLPAVD